MGKLLVSIYGGKANQYVKLDKPSEVIPFIGNFPILPTWRYDEWTNILENSMFVEDCPDWAQDAMIKGAQMYDIEKSFIQYLKTNNIGIEVFKKKSSSDKATELMRFLNAEHLTTDAIRFK